MATGRPREFDTELALDRALDLFWRKGYEGTSLPELTQAMGINRPSLYAAFGNKEALFRKAIDRYVATRACHVQSALEQPTSRAVVEYLLTATVDLITHTHGPQGCFLVQGSLASGDEASSLREELVKRRAKGERLLRTRFQRALADGDLPLSANPADLARYVTVIAHGLAVQASGGTPKSELLRVVDMVLKSWPA